MLQQVMIEPKVIEFVEVDKPIPNKGEILIKMMRIGVCGSDIHVYHGQHPFTSYPVTQGHEVAGYIEELGAETEGFCIGDKVTIEPQVVCGTCYPCTHGKYNLCEELKVMGFQTTGMASEYICVNKDRVTLLPSTMTYDEGAMIEPLAVTIHAAKQYGNINGAKVAILGCGPIGILLAQSCKAMGAESVMITDISEYRLQLAKECGVDYAINTNKIDFGKAMVESFGKDKADVIYDCAGNNVTIGQAITHARKGSKIILVAVFAGMATVDLAVLNDHELCLETSMMYRHEDYVEAIRYVGDKKIQLTPLMTKHFPFLSYNDAYEFIDCNREATMKVLIDIDCRE